jgi:hypothetical protein
VAEGGGLLNRCRASSPTVSSNLIPSASFPRNLLNIFVNITFRRVPGRRGDLTHDERSELLEYDDPMIMRRNTILSRLAL